MKKYAKILSVLIALALVVAFVPMLGGNAQAAIVCSDWDDEPTGLANLPTITADVFTGNKWYQNITPSHPQYEQCINVYNIGEAGSIDFAVLKEGVLYIQTNGLTLSGDCDYPIVVEGGVSDITFDNLTVKTDAVDAVTFLDSVTLKLSGDSSIQPATDNNAVSGHTYALLAANNLTIASAETGNFPSLAVTASSSTDKSSFAIGVIGDLTLEDDVMLNEIKSGSTGKDYHSIGIQTVNLTVKDIAVISNVTAGAASGRSAGIYVEGDLINNSSIVSITGGAAKDSYGIDIVDGTLTNNEGALISNINADEASHQSAAIYTVTDLNNYGEISAVNSADAQYSYGISVYGDLMNGDGNVEALISGINSGSSKKEKGTSVAIQVNGTLINTKNAVIENITGGDVDAISKGIDVLGSDGMENYGTITAVKAGKSTNESSWGIHVLNGSLTNAGEISEITASEAKVMSEAVSVDADLINTGIIEDITAGAAKSSAGIHVDGNLTNGDGTNAATISGVTGGDCTAENSKSFGIYVTQNLTNNAKAVITDVKAGKANKSYGIYTKVDVDNNGEISKVASADCTLADSDSNGICVAGNLTNGKSGEITDIAAGKAAEWSDGIVVNGDLTNDGIIGGASGSITSDTALISIAIDVGGKLTNNGTVSGAASGDCSGQYSASYGIRVYDSLINSEDAEIADVKAGKAYAYNSGIKVVNGDLENDGIITGVECDEAGIWSSGIWVDIGDLTNNGKITGVAGGKAVGTSEGIYVYSSLTNNGILGGESEDDVIAGGDAEVSIGICAKNLTNAKGAQLYAAAGEGTVESYGVKVNDTLTNGAFVNYPYGDGTDPEYNDIFSSDGKVYAAKYVMTDAEKADGIEAWYADIHYPEDGDTLTPNEGKLIVLGVYYVINFAPNGGTPVDSMRTYKNVLEELPTTYRSKYVFQYWANEEGIPVLDNSLIFDEKNIDRFKTLYAIWYFSVPVTKRNAEYEIYIEPTTSGSASVSEQVVPAGRIIYVNAVPDAGYAVSKVTITDRYKDQIMLTKLGDGQYSFKMPYTDVIVIVEFEKLEGEAPVVTEPVIDVPVVVEPATAFDDVNASDYFSDAVAWAVENGITNGLSATKFGPDAPCTRAQAVTFLWRLAGCPEVEANDKFTDVVKGSYYEKAVAWAVENGITLGTSDTTFSPDMICTRGHIVTFLYRYAKATAGDTVNPFTDVEAGMYYEAPVLWAVENEITTGKTATTFAPNDDCTRGQIVTFMWRMAK